MRNRSPWRTTAKEKHEQDLDPHALILGLELGDADVRGSVFAFLDHFAGKIERLGLKPWGKRGKQLLIDTIMLYAEECDYAHWIPCIKCRRFFKSVINEDLVNQFLLFLQHDIDPDEGVPADMQFDFHSDYYFAALYICKDCGGLEESPD
jgi:hypothetical protein